MSEEEEDIVLVGENKREKAYNSEEEEDNVLDGE